MDQKPEQEQSILKNNAIESKSTTESKNHLITTTV